MSRKRMNRPAFTMALVLMVALNLFASLGFLMIDAKPEAVESLVKAIKLTRISNLMPSSPIISFDVNGNGDILLGLDSSRQKAIGAYDQDMNFKDGYTLDSPGSFAANWDGDRLAIYLVRGGSAIYLDENGRVNQGTIIANTFDNSVYWNEGVFATRRTVNGVVYELRNPFGLLNILTAQSYAQLVKRLPDGTTHILYDASEFLRGLVIIRAFIFLSFVALGVWVIRKYSRDLRRAMKAKEGTDRAIHECRGRGTCSISTI